MTRSDRRFDWFYGLEEDYLYPTISVIEGSDHKEVMRILGVGGAEPEAMTAREALENVTRNVELVGLGEDCGLIFTVEAIGSTLAVPGVLRDISRDGRCVSVSFSSEGVHSFHYAVNGELVSYEFDAEETVTPLRPGDPRWNPVWSEVPNGVDDEEVDRGVHLLALVEQIMGLAPKEQWLSERLQTLCIPSSVRFQNTPAWDIP
ncbi:hypothetical protein GCM10011579_086580 [Streptomyces albiflavescens]|uniref:Uncharacterized protein n=1 Tax=Streptomyces albiflavescens TaxID=1623582 RepID=A0A917YD50_9ACTN|nr:hypothetical protein [Streptomyces albiflavescens]GGN90580.1 hypothetical protein GCM10011579_086580 [Streptomyces albiflavescens]